MPKRAARKTASTSKREPFVFDEDITVAAGHKKEIQVPLARMPAGTWATMPVVLVHGSKPGPTIWLSGAVHGDELNGIEIVRQILSHLKPKELRGTVIAAPIVNVFGVTLSSRYLPDRRDLNRSFPGSKRGSLASRIAQLFTKQVIARSDIGIDYHTGSGGRDNLPQVRGDLDDPATREIARAFHAPLMLHAKPRSGSLRATARKQGKAALIFEGGEAGRFDNHVIEIGVAGGLRVMRHRGMIAAAPAAEGPALSSRSSKWTRTSRSGFSRVLVELGDTIEEGQVLAKISNSISRRTTLIRSRRPGVVIAVLRTGLVHQGDALVHLADIEEDAG